MYLLNHVTTKTSADAYSAKIKKGKKEEKEKHIMFFFQNFILCTSDNFDIFTTMIWYIELKEQRFEKISQIR